MKRDFTKDVSVERVTPPALLGYCKAVGKSERVERRESATKISTTGISTTKKRRSGVPSCLCDMPTDCWHAAKRFSPINAYSTHHYHCP